MKDDIERFILTDSSELFANGKSIPITYCALELVDSHHQFVIHIKGVAEAKAEKYSLKVQDMDNVRELEVVPGSHSCDSSLQSHPTHLHLVSADRQAVEKIASHLRGTRDQLSQ